MQVPALRLTVLLASLPLVLAACGGDDADESADEIETSSADTSSDDPTGTSDDPTSTTDPTGTSDDPTSTTDDPTTDTGTTDPSTTDPTTDTGTTDPSTTDPTTDTGTTDPTTDTEGPACGDGNVDPGESCDDGNMVDDDTCSNACEWASRIVFITSSVHAGGDLGGLAGADAICNELAANADLPGTYMAWLSTSEGSPATRFVQSSVPYLTTAGIKVADDWADLSDGSLDMIVAKTESNGPIPNASYSCNGTARQSWTGTNGDGTPSANNCSDFTSSDSTGAVGRNSSTTEWSLCNASVTCSVTAPIYCFQQ